MESFAVLLIMSVIFLGFLFLGTALLEGIPGYGSSGYRGSGFEGPKIDLVSFPQFFLGFTKADKARSVDYSSFSVGVESSLNIRNVLEYEITNGILSYNELSLDINLHPSSISEAIAGVVSFDISDGL